MPSYPIPTVSATTFVSPDPMLVAELLANFPAGAANVGKYARVSDLYSEVDDVMRCSVSTVSGVPTYYWRPQRDDYAKAVTQTSGSMSLLPLVSPPQMFLGGTLLGNVTVTPSAISAWPGAQFRLTSTGTLGLFGISLAGLITAAVPLLTGSTRTLTFTGAGWRSD